MDSITGDIPAATMSTEWEDDYARELAEAINWQNQMLSHTFGMVNEMYKVFQALKPLVDSMPPGLLTAMPPMGVGPILPAGYRG